MAIKDWLFSRSKGDIKKSDHTKERVRLFDRQMWDYHSFNGDLIEMDLIRAAIDALARNSAKMQLQSVRRDAVTGRTSVDRTSDVARTLKYPNAIMSAYDFLYKVTALYFTTNNVFIWPEYEKGGKLLALWPIYYRQYRIVEYDGSLFVKFRMTYRNEYTVPYEDVIHLKNHYITDELSGETTHALKPVAELLNAQNQGIINGIKNSALIRGLLKTLQVIKESDLKKAKEDFIADNLRAQNSGGVIAIDGKYDYIPLDSKPYVVDAETMEAAKKKVFDYFGVNEEFLQNKFTSEQYEAVYEGRLEPFAIMLTQALTRGLYTERERGFGNEIEANLSKLKYQPLDKVIGVISSTNQLGLFTRDEFREMLGYGPLAEGEGGDDILISLNYVKSNNLDEYQDVGGNSNEE